VVDLIEEAATLQAFLDSHGLRFCVIGGLAVQWWGEPCLTRYIDISLLTGFGAEAEPVDLLLSAYAPRIADAREFALTNRVLLLRSPSGAGIDVSLAALPYEELAIGRAPLVKLMPGRTLRLCSPEDLIVMKLFAARETDIRDARSVAVRQGARLDWGYAETQLAGLADLAGNPELMARLRRLRGGAPPTSAPSTS
jgi:hypothetical protein